jgi:quercetin dioxygenase-like cupin family protein
MIQRGFLAAVVAALLATPLTAQVKFSSTPILQANVTNAGGPITYPATDSAEVTALRVDIGPGGETGRHMHLSPAFVYVLEGAIDVEIEGRGGHSYKAGEFVRRGDRHVAQWQEPRIDLGQAAGGLCRRTGQAQSRALEARVASW